MRALLPAALLLLAAPAGLTAPVPGFYPLIPGTTWTYTSGETQVVGTPTTVRGIRVTPVSHQYGGKTYTQDLLEARADGSIWLRGVNAGGRLTWYATPLNVYPPGPLHPGQHWQSGSGALKSSGSVTGTAPLRVPAGTFNALVIRTDLSVGGQQSTQITYFVPGLGVVRYQTADGSQIDLLK
ncbi:hypothetical protein DEIPH_ctg079orf0023 [Deinococcus phoenicis]|uniref:Uncharacterized protein n=1 Tax=Deinococcus phoenicis TaxID=1476583 RepID=A0A016QL96_9DEIO|nr:hypothetical protein [Deinococcus phoenicis]EYB66642.1 hypothetical protein DEIPH_ctg079orf0023 [Deinococcus phoenicis]